MRGKVFILVCLILGVVISAIPQTQTFVALTGTPTVGNIAQFSPDQYHIQGVSSTRAIAYAFGDATSGTALTTSEVGYVTVPFACTIVGWHIMLTPTDTATMKVWRINGGTALPTVSNVISDSTGQPISSGGKIDSASTAHFTSTAIAANDTLGFSIAAIGGTAQQLTFQLDCAQ